MGNGGAACGALTELHRGGVAHLVAGNRPAAACAGHGHAGIAGVAGLAGGLVARIGGVCGVQGDVEAARFGTVLQACGVAHIGPIGVVEKQVQ